jgi:hypothetical protein
MLVMVRRWQESGCGRDRRYVELGFVRRRWKEVRL